MTKSKLHLIYILVVIASFCIGLGFFPTIDYLFPTKTTAGISPLRESNLSDNPYKLIDPLLAISRPENTTSEQYVTLKDSINSFLNSEIKKNNLEIASFYLREQNTAKGFDINPEEKYSPASLIKVPIMMAYFKLAEKNPSILSKTIWYSDGYNLNLEKSIPASMELQKNKVYSIMDLIQYMIKYSDNNAYNLLVNNLNDTNQYDSVGNLFSELGISGIRFDTDYVNINSYSLFFRVLYNSTYLNREMSEKALDIMTETDFTKGIRVGVPNNILIAQKFGEFTTKSALGVVLKRELHNCGIIYYPEHPYIMCVMTKGKDFNQLENVISSISKMVFQYTKKYIAIE